MFRLTSLFMSWNTIRRNAVIGSVVGGRGNSRRRILLLLPRPSSSSLPPPLFFASHPCSKTTCRINNQFHNSQFSSSYCYYYSTSSSENRYQRFRYSLQLLLSQSSSSSSQQQQELHSNDSEKRLITVGKHAMEISSSNRRSFNRTWKRLGPLLELIVASTTTTFSSHNNKLYTIADVGCDHGILSMSLACMAHVSSSSLSSSLQQQRLQQEQQPLPSNNNNNNNDDSILSDGRGTESNKNNNNNFNNNHCFFFNRVYGIDISSKALNNGALQTLNKIMNAIPWSPYSSPLSSLSSIAEYDYSNSNNNNNNNNTGLVLPLPIEFRISNGLEALHIGEADAIVLAGMGVESMMEILFLDNDNNERRNNNNNNNNEKKHDNSRPPPPPPVDSVHTNQIYCQPTNSRPQHMMKLYDRIQHTNEWILKDESIAYSSGRWYINSFFERRQQQNQQSNNNDDDDSRFRYPGHFLVQQQQDSNNENVYDSYIKHHCQWLKDDYERTTKYVIEDEDRRWIEYILTSSNKKK